MTDEQTPKPFGDEVDPSEAGPVDPAGEFLERRADQVDQTIIDPEAEELVGTPVEDATSGKADPDEVVIDDPDQLAQAEGVAARARSSRPVRRQGKVESAPQSEDTGEPDLEITASPVVPRPVRRQSKAVEVEQPEAIARPAQPTRRPAAAAVEKTTRRTTPGVFVNQSVGELRKVIWPTATQLRQYFIVVLLFVLFIVAYVGLLDALFGWIMLKLFGN